MPAADRRVVEDHLAAGHSSDPQPTVRLPGMACALQDDMRLSYAANLARTECHANIAHSARSCRPTDLRQCGSGIVPVAEGPAALSCPMQSLATPRLIPACAGI